MKKQVYKISDFKKIPEFKRFGNNFSEFLNTNLGNFSQKILNLLVENFQQSFFVGGMVRDLLLNKKVYDVDIATSARPEQVIMVLKKAGINFDSSYQNYGNITAKQGSTKVEITTFRKDGKSKNRYPKIEFITDAYADSKRRDFTINSLYLSTKLKIIYDFQGGINDIINKQVRFIGNPYARITEDPLRILRAIRFCLVLKLNLDKKSKTEIINNFHETKKLTSNKIKKEILKIKKINTRKIFNKIITDEKNLDNYFK